MRRKKARGSVGSVLFVITNIGNLVAKGYSWVEVYVCRL